MAFNGIDGTYYKPKVTPPYDASIQRGKKKKPESTRLIPPPRALKNPYDASIQRRGRMA